MPTTDPETTMAPLHVAAAVIVDAQGRVLISKRPDHVHQGGLWEFPGGKCEPGETVPDALQRELREELGIQVTHARPLLRVHHQYPDRTVLLDVWYVDAFQGQAHGREGQMVAWVSPLDLVNYDFPAANRAIVQAARLPDRYLITPEPGDDHDAFLEALQKAMARGCRLVQLRAKTLDTAAYVALAEQVLPLVREANGHLILNGEVALVEALGAHGIQLTGQQLAACSKRPLGPQYLVGASCHTEQELHHAQAIQADFAMLSPVQATQTHPDTPALGWDTFQRWTEVAALPVYALGGMTLADREVAWRHGAQGVAAIRALWE